MDKVKTLDLFPEHRPRDILSFVTTRPQSCICNSFLRSVFEHHAGPQKIVLAAARMNFSSSPGAPETTLLFIWPNELFNSLYHSCVDLKGPPNIYGSTVKRGTRLSVPFDFFTRRIENTGFFCHTN